MNAYISAVSEWRRRCTLLADKSNSRDPSTNLEEHQETELLANFLASWNLSVCGFKQAMRLYGQHKAPKEFVLHLGNSAAQTGRMVLAYLNDHNIAGKRIGEHIHEDASYDIEAVTLDIESEVRSMAITEEKCEAFAKETGIDKLLEKRHQG